MNGRHRSMPQPLLRVEGLDVIHPLGSGRTTQAVSAVSFEIGRGEAFGLVGESGCGKSSLARAIMQLPAPTSGRVLLGGDELSGMTRPALRQARKRLQMIFQDPVASLNPRRVIGKSIELPLRELGDSHRSGHLTQVYELMRQVGLDPRSHYDRFPFQLSGGQCQRVSIARALICRPELLVCDEPVSSLDVSVQAQILNLLKDLKEAYGLSLLFISHDLAVVKNICERIAVMYQGRMCEIAPAENLYRAPAHPYTRTLIDAIPQPYPDKVVSEPPLRPALVQNGHDVSDGCAFRLRCPHARSDCAEHPPELREIAPNHQVACHFPLSGEDAW